MYIGALSLAYLRCYPRGNLTFIKMPRYALGTEVLWGDTILLVLLCNRLAPEQPNSELALLPPHVESLRLEKSTKITQSNYCPITTIAINLCPSKEKEVRKKIMDFSDDRRNSSG